MDTSKQAVPDRRDAADTPRASDLNLCWISDRMGSSWSRTAQRWTAAPELRDSPMPEPDSAGGVLLDGDLLDGDLLAGPLLSVRVDADRHARVVEEATGRRLCTLGEIRLVGRIWCFVLATRDNGFAPPLNPETAARLAQLDGARMGGPRTPDTLSAEISSLLGYDAHR